MKLDYTWHSSAFCCTRNILQSKVFFIPTGTATEFHELNCFRSESVTISELKTVMLVPQLLLSTDIPQIIQRENTDRIRLAQDVVQWRAFVKWDNNPSKSEYFHYAAPSRATTTHSEPASAGIFADGCGVQDSDKRDAALGGLVESWLVSPRLHSMTLITYHEEVNIQSQNWTAILLNKTLC